MKRRKHNKYTISTEMAGVSNLTNLCKNVENKGDVVVTYLLQHLQCLLDKYSKYRIIIERLALLVLKIC